jgi:hypothetical protein
LCVARLLPHCACPREGSLSLPHRLEHYIPRFAEGVSFRQRCKRGMGGLRWGCAASALTRAEKQCERAGAVLPRRPPQCPRWRGTLNHAAHVCSNIYFAAAGRP